jgi:hypothetical protein
MGLKDLFGKKTPPVVPPVEPPPPSDTKEGTPTNKVLSMRQQGLSNNQIVSSLQREGYQSHQIFDAMNQADIKGGVNAMQLNNPNENPNPENPMENNVPGMSSPHPFNNFPGSQGQQDLPPNVQNQQEQGTAQYNNMLSDNIPTGQMNMNNNMQGDSEYGQDMSQMPPMNGMVDSQGMQPPPFGNPGMAPDPEPPGMQPPNFAPPGMSPQEMGSQGQDVLSERIEEIAEAIIDEKWDMILKNVNKIIEWKATTESKLSRMEQEFSDLKSNFDNLHKAIIGKIGEYDKNILSVGTEVKAMEKVFQKVLPTFTENVSELSRITKSMKKR